MSGAATRPDADVVAVLGEIFDDYATNRAAPAAELVLDRALWDRLADLGLTRLTGSEDSGGSGAGWLEAGALLGAAAAAAAPVPLAEHDLLGGWLLEVAGLPVDDRLRSVGRATADGTALGVPWGRDVETVVVLVDDGGTCRVAEVPVEATEVSGRRDVSGRPMDSLALPPELLRSGAEVDPATAVELHRRGALARAAQSCGAMRGVLDVVVQHVGERTQFGRPIGRFQAVQHLVSDIAAESALATAATDHALAHAAAHGLAGDRAGFIVAVAASATGHAASTVVRSAHQALGAIGTTVEHRLHTVTRPVLAWRGEFGSVHSWDAELTRLATGAGREGLWALVTDTEENR